MYEQRRKKSQTTKNIETMSGEQTATTDSKSPQTNHHAPTKGAKPGKMAAPQRVEQLRQWQGTKTLAINNVDKLVETYDVTGRGVWTPYDVRHFLQGIVREEI